MIEEAGSLDATDIVQLNNDLRRRLHNLNGSYAEPLVLSAWIDRVHGGDQPDARHRISIS